MKSKGLVVLVIVMMVMVSTILVGCGSGDSNNLNNVATLADYQNSRDEYWFTNDPKGIISLSFSGRDVINIQDTIPEFENVFINIDYPDESYPETAYYFYGNNGIISDMIVLPVGTVEISITATAIDGQEYYMQNTMKVLGSRKSFLLPVSFHTNGINCDVIFEEQYNTPLECVGPHETTTVQMDTIRLYNYDENIVSIKATIEAFPQYGQATLNRIIFRDDNTGKEQIISVPISGQVDIELDFQANKNTDLNLHVETKLNVFSGQPDSCIISLSFLSLKVIREGGKEVEIENPPILAEIVFEPFLGE